jgi:hypothetical protein
MSQMVGLIELIELEAGGTTVADLTAPCDDATLDELFARLVAGDGAEVETKEPAGAIELAANLDLLREDLSQATRRLLQELFLTRGSRRKL